MERLQGLGALPLAAERTVVTVGFFDGVHLGHRAVLGRTVEVARERGLPSVAVTFDRHPREVLTPGQEPRLLTTVDRKADLIEETGIDVLLVLEFTEEFSRWPAEAFITRVLVDGLHAAHCAMGANFTFGHRAAGTVEMLIETGPSTASRPSVSTSSRSTADVCRRPRSGRPRERRSRMARVALGRRFVLDGRSSAARRGQGLGYPTANLRTGPRLLLPGRGIYAGRALVEGRPHVAAISVGTNPTFGVEPLHVEAYLLDFDGDIVGSEIAVEFWAYPRRGAVRHARAAVGRDRRGRPPDPRARRGDLRGSGP